MQGEIQACFLSKLWTPEARNWLTMCSRGTRRHWMLEIPCSHEQWRFSTHVQTKLCPIHLLSIPLLVRSGRTFHTSPPEQHLPQSGDIFWWIHHVPCWRHGLSCYLTKKPWKIWTIYRWCMMIYLLNMVIFQFATVDGCEILQQFGTIRHLWNTMNNWSIIFYNGKNTLPSGARFLPSTIC